MENITYSRWRITLFRGIAFILFLLYFPNGIITIVPWVPFHFFKSFPSLSVLIWAYKQSSNPEMQRWAFGLSAIVDNIIGLFCLILAVQPIKRPYLVQLLAFAMIFFIGANIPFVGFGILIAYSPFFLLILFAPNKKQLLKPLIKTNISWILLSISFIIFCIFFYLGSKAIFFQIHHNDYMSKNYGWVTIVEHLGILWLFTLFASFNKSNSSLLTICISVCFFYLSAISTLLPNNPGSWGSIGGLLSILLGCIYLFFAIQRMYLSIKQLNMTSR
jgi:hypothetical protein